MNIHHLDKQTADGTAQILEKLYQLFPSCFTESADVLGHVKPHDKGTVPVIIDMGAVWCQGVASAPYNYPLSIFHNPLFEKIGRTCRTSRT